MSFNSDALVLLTLGIHGDLPAEPGLPALADGNHLRWAPDQEVGFPWFGFYLFRRESRPARPRCLAPELERFRPGASRSLELATRLGRLSSVRPLVLTDRFAPQGVVEIDLGQGAPLRFDLPAGVEAGRVEVSIGLLEAGPETVRTCADFRGLPLGASLSPRTEKGAVFTTAAPPVSPSVAVISIEQWPGGAAGLQTTRRLQIALPCPATRVDLLLTNRGELRLEALSASGASVAVKTVDRLALSAGTVTLTGPAIARVTIDSSTVDPALLHQACWDCPGGATGTTKGPAIEVQALAGTAVVAHAVVQGKAGEVVAVSLQGEGITAVEIAAGKAALVDLCVWPAKQAPNFGWDPVPGFRYPLCLPVAEPDYPCPGKPATAADAQALAFSRVTYPAPPGWNGDFLGLHGELVALVKGGPGAGPMAGREHGQLTGTSLSPASSSRPPALASLRPLDLVYLASLQPAVAQMLGLYFVDTAVAPGVPYDYLLLADPTGVLGGSAETALAWLAFAADPARVDAVLVPNVSTQAQPPIAATGDPHAYVLPGAATRAIDGTLHEATSSVGLWWPLPPDSTQERPDQPIFYYPRRAFLGPGEPLARPPVSAYHPLQAADTPVLVSRPEASAEIGPRGSDWPPSQDAPATATTPARQAIPLHVVDGNLADGWYGYRIVVQDLFGRRSALGPEARWFEWEPPPEHERHPYAVALLDKVPPPIPLGVEAWALDPADRWVVADQPYKDWRATVTADLVGLRVGWRWTLMQQLQAPDTREFRIYHQPGRWNALLGRILAVAAGPGATAATQSEATLDLADSHAADLFAGARLRVGNDDFAILGSQPGAQLRLLVKNLGVNDEIRPAAGKPCTVAIPEAHALWVDPSLARSWARRLAYAPYDPPARTVVDPSKDAKGQVLTDVAFKDAKLSATVTVAGKVAQLPPEAALAGVQPWIDHFWIEDAQQARETRRILGVDSQAGTVTVETAFTIGPPVHWILGRPAREYEVFLAAPDVGLGQPFEPSLAEPAVYAQVAVSAADDKTHTLDDPRWNSGTDHYGNESRLSPSATVFRVRRRPPEPPELVEKPGRIFATPADYHSRSYYTFRFVSQDLLKVHVLRALDESLFRRDWLIRETRTALDPVPDPKAAGAKTDHLDFFPEGPHWDPATRQSAADAVNALAKEAPYAGLTADAWAVLALLPGNAGQPDQASLEARDQLMRHLRGQLAATDDVFPSSWNTATRLQAAGLLNGITGPESYAALPDDALRVLAALPGNEAVFAQVTHEPLAMDAAVLHDERRPDDPALFTSDPSHRAYTDTLPGRAANRYFYRARFVDGAQNQSALSGPTGPVYLPKVEPPRAPVVTKILGGERQISLQWAANREPDLAEYRVYRTDGNAAALDIRLMTQIATLAVSVADRNSPPAAVTWSDSNVAAAKEYGYRVTAANAARQESAPSRAVAAAAVDTSIPPPATWTEAKWVLLSDLNGTEVPWPMGGVIPPGMHPAVRLVWTSVSRGATFRVARRLQARTAWRPIAVDGGATRLSSTTFLIYDRDASPESDFTYRVLVVSWTGVPGVEPTTVDVTRPS